MSANNGNIVRAILEAEVYKPQAEDFKIYYADDMSEVKAMDSNGVEIPFSSNVVDTNIGNTDMVLTANRSLTGSLLRSLSFTDLLSFLMTSVNDVSITAGGIIELVSTSNLDISSSKITYQSEDFLSFDAGLGRFLIGNAARVNRLVGTLTVIDTEAQIDKIRGSNTADTGIELGLYTNLRKSLGAEGGAVAHFVDNTVGASHVDSILYVVQSDSANRFKIMGDGRMTVYGTRSFVDVATAQADATLEVGETFTLNVGTADEQSILRIKK